MIALAALKALAATGRFQRVFVLARRLLMAPLQRGLFVSMPRTLGPQRTTAPPHSSPSATHDACYSRCLCQISFDAASRCTSWMLPA
jgi:hypothetical protein